VGVTGRGPELRVLRPGDETALDAFLADHADTSMFLRANARAAGLSDRGAPLEATYMAALEGGHITGVAAHCWNGMVLVQAPAHAGALACHAVRRSGRAVTGLSGPWAQVVSARAALGLASALTAKDSRDELYVLDLARLVVPQPLVAGELRVRHPATAELALLVGWRVSFSVEALGAPETAELRRVSQADIRLQRERGADWVLVAGDRLVAYAAFNAMLPEIVQIGGVWTPPAERGRGYARSVVAGALLAAGTHGVRRAVLFADPANDAARRAYCSIGFRIVGDYGLVLFAL
jgi:RimJ/RimL family protein N-acetyltransferase